MDADVCPKPCPDHSVWVIYTSVRGPDGPLRLALPAVRAGGRGAAL